MRKTPWSISTTVRNPERLRAFLRVLKQLEGSDFKNENQIQYQVLLIKKRLYNPTKIPTSYRSLIDDFAKEIPLDVARKIFDFQHYEDPPMRGRQSVNPLNKLGFSIAKKIRQVQLKLRTLVIYSYLQNPISDIYFLRAF